MNRAMEYIHSLFPPSYDGHKELNRLYEQLRTIESIKKVTDSKGWQDIKRWAIDNVVEYDAQIVMLSDNPAKNQNEIRFKRATREAILTFINGIDGQVSAESQLKQRITEIAETLHNFEPEEETQEDETLPVGGRNG